MKKFYSLFVLILLFSLNLKAKKVEGQICLEDDTLNVTLIIPIDLISKEIDYWKLQHAIGYIDAYGKKRKFAAGRVKEVRFTYNYEKIRLLARENTLGIKRSLSEPLNVFLKLEMDGYLKLFSSYYQKNMTNTFFIKHLFVFQKGNEELKKIGGWSFKKNMRGYFDDCPQIAEKIENKEFKEGDIKLIVNTYNFDCH